MTLTASICHGYGIYFFLCHESMPGGANWSVEIATGPDNHVCMRFIALAVVF